MIQVRKNSIRLGRPAALLLLGWLLAGCSTAPPDPTDVPPIADADFEAASPIGTAALQPAALHPVPQKLPRLLMADKAPRLLNAVEVHDLHAPAPESAPALQAAPDVVPAPREADSTETPKPAKTASLAPTSAPQSLPKTAVDAEKEFEWPVVGKVISGFGSDDHGARNDGINIAADPGTPIHAAAAGTVTYAGRLKGYGNLVLIRHSDGYITAYAHAQSLLVAAGDRVARGDVIGLSGKSGGVATPQLHFEIREGTKAVDPRPLMLSSRES